MGEGLDARRGQAHCGFRAYLGRTPASPTWTLTWGWSNGRPYRAVCGFELPAPLASTSSLIPARVATTSVPRWLGIARDTIVHPSAARCSLGGRARARQDVAAGLRSNRHGRMRKTSRPVRMMLISTPRRPLALPSRDSRPRRPSRAAQ